MTLDIDMEKDRDFLLSHSRLLMPSCQRVGHNKMSAKLRPLHPESEAIVKMREGRKPYFELPLKEARELALAGSRVLQGSINYNGNRTEILVPSPNGIIPCYVYNPDSVSEVPAVLVYFHGGGMVIGSRDVVDTICKILSSEAGCIVVNVEYRLAPEHQQPAQYNDGMTVVQWVLDNKEKIGASPLSRVGAGGDSAGATITAALAHDTPQLAFQLLIYTHVQPASTFVLPSFIEFEHDPIINRTTILWFEKMYIAKGDERSVIRASTLRERFDHLPPALFIVAECDPLRDDNYEYCEKLQAAGVRTELVLAKGALHGFFTLPGHYKELTKEPIARTVKWLKTFCGESMNSSI